MAAKVSSFALCFLLLVLSGVCKLPISDLMMTSWRDKVRVLRKYVSSSLSAVLRLATLAARCKFDLRSRRDESRRFSGFSRLSKISESVGPAKLTTSSDGKTGFCSLRPLEVRMRLSKELLRSGDSWEPSRL
nr:hypothetical protein Iba_chr04bCG9850 [Ipomoea batatas]